MEEKQDNNSQAVATDQLSDNESQLKALLPIYIPIGVAIVVANVLVFVLFARKRNLRTPTNMFLLSLSISDCVNGLVNIPLFLMLSLIFPLSIEGNRTVIVLHNFTLILTAYHILGITAERYFAIMKPFRRQSLLSKSFAVKVILVIWLISGIIAVIEVPIILYGYLTLTKIYLIFYFIAAFILPFLFIFFAYVVMFCTIRKRKSFARRRNDSRTYRKLSSDRKCLFVFSTMLIVFLVCWCPSYVLRMIIWLVDPKYWSSYPHMVKIIKIFTAIRYFSSVLNPLLYTLLKTDFLNALKTFRRKSNERRLRSSTAITRGVTMTANTSRMPLVSEKYNIRKPIKVPKHLQISLMEKKQGTSQDTSLTQSSDCFSQQSKDPDLNLL